MKDLIPISKTALNGAVTQTADGRALHAFLESSQHYTDWMKNRIDKYGFVEGIDFVIFHNSIKNPEGGRPATEHALTLDMAKQLAMVENNEKGKQARLYFIECERLALEAAKPAANPRRSEAELNARSAAVSLRMMARMGVYPKEMQAVLLAKSVNLLTGEPLDNLLPSITNGREGWKSPTSLGETLGVSANMVGRLLKSTGLHGDNDPDHRWSQPIWNKATSSDRQVTSYVYNSEFVLPKLKEALTTPKPEPGAVLNFTDAQEV